MNILKSLFNREVNMEIEELESQMAVIQARKALIDAQHSDMALRLNKQLAALKARIDAIEKGE